MKSALSKAFPAAILIGLMFSPLNAGTEILLYPFARMFGVPSETELAKCRLAFQQLQTNFGTSLVVVQPVLFVDGDRREWRKDLAEAVVREASASTKAKLAVANSAPDTAPAQFRNNQLRYTWERAAEYARWVKANHPSENYVWFVEIWGHDGKVAAIQVYVLDANGQIAYCSHRNSHQFGPNLPLQGDEVIPGPVKQFFQDLPKAPEKLFPPYGVG